MKKTLILILGLLIGTETIAQQYGCGTEATPAQLEYMDSLNFNMIQARNANLQVRVPLKFHIINRSTGLGGLNPSRIASLIAEVNNSFSGSGITFFNVGDPEVINNDQFFDLDASEENELANGRDVSGVINMYVSGTLTSGGSNLCGYTRFPPSSDRVFLALGCTANSYETTAHELGHYFTLFHTHGKTNTGTTDELVVRENCDRLGDNLCDTPADPNLSGVVSGCRYTGSARDANGDMFNPDPSNIMSYAPNSCRNTFTRGQLNRMVDGLTNGRSYLNIVYENFTARFVANTRSGCAPLTIQFTDNTAGSSSRVWTFEGGDIDRSVVANPEVTYNEPGTYKVTLVARNSGGAESETVRNNFITINDVFELVLQDTSFQDFASPEIPDKWEISNYDQLGTYSFSDVSYDDTGRSIFINNYDYDAQLTPQIDDLELSAFDFQEVKAFQLSFNYAYTYVPGDFFEGISPGTDRIEVGYKLDCSDRFYSIYENGGDEFKTAPESNDFFQPTDASQWGHLSFVVEKEDVVNKEDLVGHEFIQTIRPVIRNNCFNGNNFYLDNIKVVPDFSLDSIQAFRVSTQTEDQIALRWFNPAVNEKGIEIERSTDGINFSVIGVVDRNESSFIDESIPADASFLYYRAVNFNNQTRSSYTPVIEVSLVVTSNKIEQDDVNNINVYPNPSLNGIVNIGGDCSEISSIHSIKVYSATGQLQLALSKDDLDNTNGTISFSINELKAGMYFVVLDGVNICDNVFRIIKR